MVVPEDPFLVGGFLKKLSIPKAPIVLPKKKFKRKNLYKACLTFGGKAETKFGLTIDPTGKHRIKLGKKLVALGVPYLPTFGSLLIKAGKLSKYSGPTPDGVTVPLTLCPKFKLLG